MKSVLIIFFIFCLSCLCAQEQHFVFIQSDNNQPFYVFLNNQLHSSTAAGYMIIPKLDGGNYNFSIGFPKNAYPEQSLQIVIDNKDLGFTLKNIEEKGWGLLNLQSANIIMAENAKTNNISKALSEKDIVKEDFEPVISFDRKKKDVVVEQATTINAADTLLSKKEEETNIQKDDAITSNSAVAASQAENIPASGGVEKVSETKQTDGLHLAYVEDIGKKTDTINIIIPSDQSEITAENNNSNAEAEIVTGNDTSNKSSAFENLTPPKDSLNSSDTKINETEKDIKKKSVEEENKVSVITNSKCTNAATDEDYTRLRRKMAAVTTDEKMINEARKVFRNKCFTTNQIKRLSTLFLSDEGRYNFFNASYNSVSDVSEYSSLQSEFIDPAFTNRFKALLQ